MRVFIDNDFSGDPDDLFQLVHHLLSPSVDIRGIIGSHLRPDDPLDSSGRSAANAAEIARKVLRLMGMENQVPVHEGAPRALDDDRRPIPSAASAALIEEALREDADLPLFLVCGAGLTDLASALLLEPRIAERLTVIWIGGNEYPGLALPLRTSAFPGAALRGSEYNLNIDIAAARSVFNGSSVPLWQVPRNAYRQCLASYAELEARVAPCGRLGRFLFESLRGIAADARGRGANLGETYVLGDSPLVLLTALQCSFQADASSSSYVLRDRPELLADGNYGDSRGSGRIRVYTELDTRLMFEDFYMKLRRFARVGLINRLLL
jgi:purine nucleosidase